MLTGMMYISFIFFTFPNIIKYIIFYFHPTCSVLTHMVNDVPFKFFTLKSSRTFNSSGIFRQQTSTSTELSHDADEDDADGDEDDVGDEDDEDDEDEDEEGLWMGVGGSGMHTSITGLLWGRLESARYISAKFSGSI